MSKATGKGEVGTAQRVTPPSPPVPPLTQNQAKNAPALTATHLVDKEKDRDCRQGRGEHHQPYRPHDSIESKEENGEMGMALREAGCGPLSPKRQSQNHTSGDEERSAGAVELFHSAKHRIQRRHRVVKVDGPVLGVYARANDLH